MPSGTEVSVPGSIVAVLMVVDVQEMSLPSQEGSPSKRAHSPQETTSKAKRVRFEGKKESDEQTLPGPSQAPPLRAQDAASSSVLSSDETISTPGSACDRPNPPEPISKTFPERRMDVRRSLGDGVSVILSLKHAT